MGFAEEPVLPGGSSAGALLVGSGVHCVYALPAGFGAPGAGLAVLCAFGFGPGPAALFVDDQGGCVVHAATSCNVRILSG